MAERPSHDDITTTSTAHEQLRCPVCWTAFQRVRRQRYCSDNCRKTAWARRRTATTSTPPPPPPPGRRRDVTVYSCPSCESRYHGQQWCPDCNQPCTRVGLGGRCPHCDEPVAITDLLDPQEALNR
jgi:hypothetical protein